MKQLTALTCALALGSAACAVPLDDDTAYGQTSDPLREEAAPERRMPSAPLTAADARPFPLRVDRRMVVLDPSGTDPDAGPEPAGDAPGSGEGTDGSLDEAGVYPDGTEPEPPPESGALPDGTIPDAPPEPNAPPPDPNAPSPDGTLPDPDAPSPDGTDPDAPSDAGVPDGPTPDPEDPCLWSDGTIDPSCLP